MTEESKEECKHEFMNPYIETRTNSRGKDKRYSIWMCERYGCGYKEDRENVEIFFSERDPRKYDVYTETADDIRLIRILSSHLSITPKEVIEKLKLAKEDNPIEYQGEFFWTN